jgi:hypothetical protein
MTHPRHCEPSEAINLFDRRASFFEKKEAKKLLVRFAPIRQHPRPIRAKRPKSFLVTFFQKSNCFPLSFPKALSSSC